MAYKRLINDIVSDYSTGNYDSIEDFYNVVVNESIPAYNLSDVCLDDVFAFPHTLDEVTCGVNYTSAINYLFGTYNTDQMILAYKLFGYEYEFYLNDCDDNGACICSNRNINGRNLISKKLYGVLTDNGYLDNNYSRGYLMQLQYNELAGKLYISDEHSQTYPPYDLTYFSLNPDYYKSKMILTYLGFDKTNAKFLEQIVLEGDHNSTGIWEYEIGSTDCYHGNRPDCIVSEEDFTNIVLTVDYVDANGYLVSAEYTQPIIQSYPINYDDGKAKLDGVYKTYFFKIPDLIAIFNETSNSNLFIKERIYYFTYIESGKTVQDYCILNKDLDINFTTNPIVVAPIGDNLITYDITTNQGIIDFKEAYFTSITGIDFLLNIGAFRNVINFTNTTSIDSFVGEDSHLITYNLRHNIIKSIKDCTIPCERFSFDTWMALMQKKMAAQEMFCQNNLTEAARIMSTVEERCKNCR